VFVLPPEDAVTLMSNRGRTTELVPSVTEIEMPLATPAAVGVPVRRPDEVLKVAQDGLLLIENRSVWPSGSLAVGVNEYALPTVAVVGGEPVMVGGLFDDALTCRENAGRLVRLRPSLTEMTMLRQVRASEAEGVPDRRPVVDENDRNRGLFEIENVSLLRSGSHA